MLCGRNTPTLQMSATDSKYNTASDTHDSDIPNQNVSHKSLSAKLIALQRKDMGNFMFMTCVAIIIGLITGILIFIFKTSISLISGYFKSHICADSINWWIAALPLGGILLTGIFTRYVVRDNLTHVTGRLLHMLKNKIYVLRQSEVYSAMIGGIITLGLGGSSGAEGPSAFTGAAIGSNIGQKLKLPPDKLKILIGCGASAGISAVFSAPVGGLLFSLELLRINVSTLSVLAITTSSLVAYLTSFTLSGSQSSLIFHTSSLFQLSWIPPLILLGVVCGMYSLYYSSVINHMDGIFKRIRNPWISNITGGLAIGLILLLFPSMYGVGYNILNDVIAGDYSAMANGSLLRHTGLGIWLLPASALGIALIKCWAVSSTNSSGGVGGDFAPTLYSGGMMGYFTATLCNSTFSTSYPCSIFAYLGMAGVMSGVIQAPLMSIFIVLEMCQFYTLSLPVATVAIVSYLTVRLFDWSKDHLPIVWHSHWFKRRTIRRELERVP